MKRLLLPGMLVLLAGCVVPPERAAMTPLPENGPPLTYAELLTRARKQATAATELYYEDRWSDVEDAAKALEQTARFLAKAVEVPAKNKDNLLERSGDLAKEAQKLREAAAAKNVDATTESLKRINTKVRALRLAD